MVAVDFQRYGTIIGLFIWLFGIGVGGYLAARQGRTTGWTNSLVVGVLAEFFVAARLLNGTSLVALIDDAGANWRRLVALGLTIPAAFVGGVAWEKTCRSGVTAEQSEPASGPEAQEKSNAARSRG